MKVSVVIPNYNGYSQLEICLESLIKQTFRDFEIIVVDNGSNDNSCIFVKKKFPQVRLIRLSENLGFSKAVNIGIKASSGEYIALLNNDIECKEDWLKKLVDSIQDEPRIFSVSSKMLQFYNRNKIDDAGDEISALGIVFQSGNNLPHTLYSKKREIFSACAGAALYKKDLLEKLGYLDENFFAYLEDVDLGYRAKIYGYKNFYCPDAIVYHMSSATSNTIASSLKIQLSARNNIYLIYKNMPLIQLIINGPFLISGILLNYIISFFKGTKEIYILGIKEGIKSLSLIKRVEYTNKHFLNYVKVQNDLFLNIIRFIYLKIRVRIS